MHIFRHLKNSAVDRVVRGTFFSSFSSPFHLFYLCLKNPVALLKYEIYDCENVLAPNQELLTSTIFSS